MSESSPSASHDASSGAGLAPPSPWVQRFAALIRPAGKVLDLACGSGRHARWLAERGFEVEAVDRDAAALQGLRGVPGIHTRLADLEAAHWPFEEQRFDAIVVTNYLYRPHFGAMLELAAAGGVLIYETFMVGHERFGKPSRADFLLQPGELLQRVGEGWNVVAFEQGEVSAPRPAVIQRICALKGEASALRLAP